MALFFIVGTLKGGASCRLPPECKTIRKIVFIGIFQYSFNARPWGRLLPESDVQMDKDIFQISLENVVNCGISLDSRHGLD
jgi:hypothetical protein